MEETLSALDDVVRAGRVHAIGASNIEARRLADSLSFSERQGLARFEWVQNSYSLLERGQETEVLPLCAEQGLGFTPFSPLAGGWLTGKYRAPDNYPEGSRMTLRPEPYQHLVHEKVFGGLEAFRRHAAERGVSMAVLAMAWALSHARTSAIVIGPRKPDHLDVAREALEIRLTAAQRDELAALFDR